MRWSVLAVVFCSALSGLGCAWLSKAMPAAESAASHSAYVIGCANYQMQFAASIGKALSPAAALAFCVALEQSPTLQPTLPTKGVS